MRRLIRQKRSWVPHQEEGVSALSHEQLFLEDEASYVSSTLTFNAYVTAE